MQKIVTALAVLGLGLAIVNPALAGPTEEQARQEGLPMSSQQPTGHWVFVPNGSHAPSTSAANPGINPTIGQGQDRATGSQSQQ